MQILIKKVDDRNILITKDFAGVRSRSEIAQFIAELQCIIKDLVELYDEFDDDDYISIYGEKNNGVE